MYEPRIVCFFCKWCTYAGADLAGTSRKQYPPNGVVVRVNCSGRIDPQHLLWAFREGADGVLIGGCHPGDCHYQDGNYKTMRRVTFLKRMLEDMGIEPERLHLEWISAAEGDKLVHTMSDFIDLVKGLGALELEPVGRRGNGGSPPARRGTKKAKPAKKVVKKKAKPAKKAVKKKAKPAKKVVKKKAAPAKKVVKKKVVKKKAKPAKKVMKKRAKPAKKAVKKKAAPAKKVMKKRAAPKKKVVKKKAASKKTTRKRKSTRGRKKK